MMKQQEVASIKEAGERKTILIVEDDPDTGLVLVSALSQYTLLAPLLVESGSEALRVVEERKPDLFLLDYWLGGMDGIELCDRLHCMRGLETVPTIVMSAATIPLEREEQLSARHIVLLRKPFDLDVLFETIAALLTERQTA
jgi:putative two-component system response regulator